MFRFFQRSAATESPSVPEVGNESSERGGLHTRMVRANTDQMDEKSRTFPAILATEGRVLVFDYRSGGAIEEVLVASGGTFPERMPLLDSHSRWSSRSVLGSVRGIRVDGDKLRGTVHFGRSLGEEVDQIWNRIAEGHLTDGSIGYRYGDDDYVDIKPGQRAVIAGREWEAGNRTLRVVSRWRMHEYSVTPIGADEAAKLMRSGNPGSDDAMNQESDLDDIARGRIDSDDHSKGNKPMNKALLRFLRSLGLASDASEDRARTFRDSLGGDAAERASRIERGEEQFSDGDEGQSDAGTRSDASGGSEEGQGPTVIYADRQESGGEDVETAVQRALRAERERVAHASGFEGQVDSGLIQRAISEGWTRERKNSEFLENLRASRSNPVGGTIGVHVANRDVTRRALQAAFLARSGFDLDNDLFAEPEVRHAISDRQSNARWLAEAYRAHRNGQVLGDDASRALDMAQRMRGMSIRDICSEALVIEGVRFDRYDFNEMWRYALSSAAVSDIFTTHFAVQFMAGFVGKPDTTRGWTRESDLPNLQKVERKQMGKGTPLQRRLRGQTADHLTIDAIGEEYNLAEYAGQFFVDIQDAIDDRFGALDVMPDEMGEAAMEIRPDLVYTILLSNPDMGRDSKALFHDDRDNLHADRGLTSTDLAFAKTKMSTQKKGDRLVGVMPRGLVIPDSKEDIAWELVNSPEKRDNNDGKVYGTRNWAQGRFNVVPEPRLDVGVINPETKVFVAGQPDAQFLVAEGGRYGIEVGFLQGTGRRPTMRRFTATEGRFGFGWDIQHFVGAKAVGHEGLAKMVDPST